MPNKQIIDYIKENLSTGISIEKIKKALLDTGWPEHEINEAINPARRLSSDKGIPPSPRENTEKKNILPVLSLIFAFVFPIIGVILGIIALSEIKKNPNLKGRKLAIAGIVISCIFIIFNIIFYAFISNMGYFNFLVSIVGFMNHGKYIPSSCEMPSGLSCINLGVESGNKVSFFIKNEMEEDLSHFSVKIGGECEGDGKANNGLKKGEQELITVRCKKRIEGETFREDILIEYKGENGTMQTKKGLIEADKFSTSIDDLSFPSECRIIDGLNCSDFSVVSGNPGSISLTIENEMGHGIIVGSIKITEFNNKYECYIDLEKESPGGPNTYHGLNGWHLANGEKESVKLICPIESTGHPDIKTRADIIFAFCDNISLDNDKCGKFTHHTMNGEIYSYIK